MMAREVIEKLVDDLDGGEATESVAFALDGTSFEIDLSKKNRRRSGSCSIATSRRVGVVRRSAGGAARRPRRRRVEAERAFDIAELREWAGANDVTVPARGRIPQAVVDQYKQAGGR